MVDHFYEVALDKFREKKASYISRVASGNAQNIEDYRALCGKIHGIEEAEAILKELYDVMVNQKIIN